MNTNKNGRKSNQEVIENKIQFCKFWLSDRLFGVNILDVKEINSEIDFFPIYHAPAEVRGYVNIRGQIHLILDLRVIMGFEPDGNVDGKKLIIFKPHVGDSLGILVDKIDDIVEVNESEIEERRKKEHRLSDGSPERHTPGGLTAGVCKLENYLMIVLKPAMLLKTVRIEATA